MRVSLGNGRVSEFTSKECSWNNRNVDVCGVMWSKDVNFEWYSSSISPSVIVFERPYEDGVAWGSSLLILLARFKMTALCVVSSHDGLTWGATEDATTEHTAEGAPEDTPENTTEHTAENTTEHTAEGAPEDAAEGAPPSLWLLFPLTGCSATLYPLRLDETEFNTHVRSFVIPLPTTLPSLDSESGQHMDLSRPLRYNTCATTSLLPPLYRKLAPSKPLEPSATLIRRGGSEISGSFVPNSQHISSECASVTQGEHVSLVGSRPDNTLLDSSQDVISTARRTDSSMSTVPDWFAYLERQCDSAVLGDGLRVSDLIVSVLPEVLGGISSRLRGVKEGCTVSALSSVFRALSRTHWGEAESIQDAVDTQGEVAVDAAVSSASVQLQTIWLLSSWLQSRGIRSCADVLKSSKDPKICLQELRLQLLLHFAQRVCSLRLNTMPSIAGNKEKKAMINLPTNDNDNNNNNNSRLATSNTASTGLGDSLSGSMGPNGKGSGGDESFIHEASPQGHSAAEKRLAGSGSEYEINGNGKRDLTSGGDRSPRVSVERCNPRGSEKESIVRESEGDCKEGGERGQGDVSFEKGKCSATETVHDYAGGGGMGRDGLVDGVQKCGGKIVFGESGEEGLQAVAGNPGVSEGVRGGDKVVRVVEGVRGGDKVVRVVEGVLGGDNVVGVSEGDTDNVVVGVGEGVLCGDTVDKVGGWVWGELPDGAENRPLKKSAKKEILRLYAAIVLKEGFLEESSNHFAFFGNVASIFAAALPLTVRWLRDAIFEDYGVPEGPSQNGGRTQGDSPLGPFASISVSPPRGMLVPEEDRALSGVSPLGNPSGRQGVRSTEVARARSASTPSSIPKEANAGENDKASHPKLSVPSTILRGHFSQGLNNRAVLFRPGINKEPSRKRRTKSSPSHRDKAIGTTTTFATSRSASASATVIPGSRKRQLARNPAAAKKSRSAGSGSSRDGVPQDVVNATPARKRRRASAASSSLTPTARTTLYPPTAGEGFDSGCADNIDASASAFLSPERPQPNFVLSRSTPDRPRRMPANVFSRSTPDRPPAEPMLSSVAQSPAHADQRPPQPKAMRPDRTEPGSVASNPLPRMRKPSRIASTFKRAKIASSYALHSSSSSSSIPQPLPAPADATVAEPPFPLAPSDTVPEGVATHNSAATVVFQHIPGETSPRVSHGNAKQRTLASSDETLNRIVDQPSAADIGVGVSVDANVVVDVNGHDDQSVAASPISGSDSENGRKTSTSVSSVAASPARAVEPSPTRRRQPSSNRRQSRRARLIYSERDDTSGCSPTSTPPVEGTPPQNRSVPIPYAGDTPPLTRSQGSPPAESAFPREHVEGTPPTPQSKRNRPEATTPPKWKLEFPSIAPSPPRKVSAGRNARTVRGAPESPLKQNVRGRVRSDEEDSEDGGLSSVQGTQSPRPGPRTVPPSPVVSGNDCRTERSMTSRASVSSLGSPVVTKKVNKARQKRPVGKRRQLPERGKEDDTEGKEGFDLMFQSSTSDVPRKTRSGTTHKIASRGGRLSQGLVGSPQFSLTAGRRTRSGAGGDILPSSDVEDTKHTQNEPVAGDDSDSLGSTPQKHKLRRQFKSDSPRRAPKQRCLRSSGGKKGR